MSRTVFPYQVADIAAVARSLKAQWAEEPRPPGHVELLNMLARAAGYRNFQHYRAQVLAVDALEAPPAAAPVVDYAKVQRWLRYFGPDGRFVRWPTKFSDQEPCLWVLWSRVPARETFTERQVNQVLNGFHGFGDPALLRRALVEHRLMARKPDCTAYWRVEQEPPAEMRALIRAVTSRLP